MRILSIDSSSPNGSVAILEENKIIHKTTLKGTATYSSSMLSLTAKVLSEAHRDLHAMQGFSLTIGPGSFTGLRVGVSIVKGFVLATQKPFAGINTLEAFAALVEPTDLQICPILDARKKELYAAFFKYENRAIRRHTSDGIYTLEKLAANIYEPTLFIGPGLESYGKALSQNLGSLFVKTANIKNHSAAASAGLIASRQWVEESSTNLDSLKINYLRKPEAEIKWNEGTH